MNIKPWERCARSKSLHKYISYAHMHARGNTHTHTHSWASLPSRHSHTRADNSVSQGALSLTLWPPPDKGSSWTGTHGCLELTSPGELEGEEFLSASENDQLSFHSSVHEGTTVSTEVWAELGNAQQCSVSVWWKINLWIPKSHCLRLKQKRRDLKHYIKYWVKI